MILAFQQNYEKPFVRGCWKQASDYLERLFYFLIQSCEHFISLANLIVNLIFSKLMHIETHELAKQA